MRSSKFTLIYLMIAAPFLWGACGFYKFNVTSIDPAVESVSVDQFDNNAPVVNPTLGNTLGDKLRNKFITESNLSLVEREGDFSFSGTIVRYEVAPVASQDNAVATLNRLTIGVKVKLECEKATKHNFEQSFTQFEDFDASRNLSEVENDLIESITENLVNEIFNKATLDW